MLISHPVMSNFLWLNGLQHDRPPCPSPSPGVDETHVHWVGDAIQPSHLLSPPSPPVLNLSQHQGFFPVSQLFTSGGQSIGTSFLASVLPMKNQDVFPLWLMGLISWMFQGLSGVFSSTSAWKYQFFGSPLLYAPNLTFIRDYWKNHSFDYIMYILLNGQTGAPFLPLFFPSGWVQGLWKLCYTYELFLLIKLYDFEVRGGM